MPHPDCDCWTNGRGEWVMGPRCGEQERDEWRRMMAALPTIIQDIKTNRRREPKFRYFDGKLRLVVDRPLPED